MAAAGVFPELWGNIPREKRTKTTVGRAAFRLYKKLKREELLWSTAGALPESDECAFYFPVQPGQASSEEGICALLQEQPLADEGQNSGKVRSSERLSRKRKARECNLQQPALEERWWESSQQSALGSDVDLMFKEILQDLESSTDDDGSYYSPASKKRRRESIGPEILIWTNLAGVTGVGSWEDGSPGLLALDPVDDTVHSTGPFNDGTAAWA